MKSCEIFQVLVTALVSIELFWQQKKNKNEYSVAKHPKILLDCAKSTKSVRIETNFREIWQRLEVFSMVSEPVLKNLDLYSI